MVTDLSLGTTRKKSLTDSRSYESEARFQMCDMQQDVSISLLPGESHHYGLPQATRRCSGEAKA